MCFPNEMKKYGNKARYLIEYIGCVRKNGTTESGVNFFSKNK